MLLEVLIINTKMVGPMLGAEALHYCTLVANDKCGSYPGIIAVPETSYPHSIAIACCMVEIYLFFGGFLLEVLAVR
jgi:hypothetical protein